MNSKTLVKNSAAVIEVELANEETTKFDHLATKVINPSTGVVGKQVIINLPIDSDIELICRRNKVVSRFPLDVPEGVKYEFIPYPEVDYKMKPNHRPYSNMILNKWMLLDPNYITSMKDRYLLAIEPITNNEINCSGYMLLHTIKQ